MTTRHSMALAIAGLGIVAASAPGLAGDDGLAHTNQDGPAWTFLSEFWLEAWNAPFIPGRSSMLLAGPVVIVSDAAAPAPIALGWFDEAARLRTDASTLDLSLEEHNIAAGVITGNGGVTIPILAMIDVVDGLEIMTPVVVTETLTEALEAFDIAARAMNRDSPLAATDCDTWRGICAAGCYGIYEPWARDCVWSTATCIVQCASPEGVPDPQRFLRCIGGCVVAHGRCRRDALEFFLNCYTTCVESRGCAPTRTNGPASMSDFIADTP